MKLLSPGDAARVLGVSVPRMAQFDREGTLPAIKDSAGRRFWDEDAVRAFADIRAQQRQASIDAGLDPRHYWRLRDGIH